MKWTPFESTHSPDQRDALAAVVLDGTLYFIGGWLRQYSTYSDVLVFNIAQQVWSLLPLYTVTPAACATVVAYHSRLYMYGGAFQTFGGVVYAIDTITEIDVANLTSRVLNVSVAGNGSLPAARQLHTASVYGNLM